MPQLRNGGFISEKQFNVLFTRNYSKNQILEMSETDVYRAISAIAKNEGWTGNKRKEKPVKRVSKKARREDRGRHALALAEHRCLRCGTDKHPRAYSIVGSSSQAVLCASCYQLVVHAAFMEFTPEYANDSLDSEFRAIVS